MAAANKALTLNLLIDTKSRRVLFAETNKDCVDFLFHILSLPVAKIISLLKHQGMTGSLANIYESVTNLDESYIQENQTKFALLNPVPPVRNYSTPLMLSDEPTVKKLYTCTYSCSANNVSEDPTVSCPSCRRTMSAHVSRIAPANQKPSYDGGFVKGVVNYMVLDNLVVMPLSTKSTMTLLDKFDVKEVSALEEKVVNLGMDEAVKLLKASLQSKEVLTDVFLENVIGSELQVDANKMSSNVIGLVQQVKLEVEENNAGTLD